jgi:hypothetical protein
MTADQCHRLIEVVTHQAIDATESERRELRELANALRDEIVRLDSEDDSEAGAFDEKTAKEIVDIQQSFAELAYKEGIAGATEAILASQNVFVVEEPVPAGSLPPDTLVYRKHEPK